MKVIQLPKLNPAGKTAIFIGLIILSLDLWLSAIMVGLMLFALMPAICNAFHTLPVRAIVILLSYSIVTLAYVILGCLMMKLAVCLKNGGQLRGSYVIVTCVTLVLLAVCHLLLESTIIARL